MTKLVWHAHKGGSVCPVAPGTRIFGLRQGAKKRWLYEADVIARAEHLFWTPILEYAVARDETIVLAKTPEKSESQRRKETPMYRGLLKYFPLALAAVAAHSYAANEKHNPGEELHWARGKSDDHDDCIIRHSADMARGEVFDPVDGYRHATARAWRALAALELELEKADGNQ